MTTPDALKELLCEQWCADAVVAQDEGGLRLSLPMYEADGDAVTVWLRPELGGWVIEDNGTTYMRLSYDMDLELLEGGQRAKVLEAILQETAISDEGGNLRMVVPEGDLGTALFTFGQAIGRIGDMRLWSRTRVATTFYEDLFGELQRIVGKDNVVANYHVPEIKNSDDYVVDFCVKGGLHPLYVFGIPTPDKARLATIILQQFAAVGLHFESLIVPSDIAAIPQKDLRRLMNAANDMVDGLSARDALERKVRHRIAA